MENVVFLSVNDVHLSPGICISLHSLHFDVLVGIVVGYSNESIEVLALNGFHYFCDFDDILSVEKIA